MARRDSESQRVEAECSRPGDDGSREEPTYALASILRRYPHLKEMAVVGSCSS